MLHIPKHAAPAAPAPAQAPSSDTRELPLPPHPQELPLPPRSREPLPTRVWAEARAHPRRVAAIGVGFAVTLIATTILTSPTSSPATAVTVTPTPAITEDPTPPIVPTRTRAPRTHAPVVTPPRRPATPRTAPLRSAPSPRPSPTPTPTPSPTHTKTSPPPDDTDPSAEPIKPSPVEIP